jgi:hypothetical protein
LDEYSGENSTGLSSIFFDYEITFGEQKELKMPLEMLKKMQTALFVML